LFGEIVDGDMILNEPGMMVANAWEEFNQRFFEVETDTYTEMPNHLHGIIWLVGAPLGGCLKTVLTLGIVPR
jgi:hypothetical protein